MLKSIIIGFGIFAINLAPIATKVSIEKLDRALTAGRQGFEGAGGCQRSTKGELRFVGSLNHGFS